VAEVNVASFGGRMIIHTHGLREFSKDIGGAPKEVRKAVAANMRQAAEPIAKSAQSHARAISFSGDFAASIKIAGGRSGVSLVASDKAAGPIDFARPGARGLSGKWAGKPIGVPDGSPSRALYPGIEDSIDEVAQNLSDVIDAVTNDYDRVYATQDSR
jgi:hypothetical protein